MRLSRKNDPGSVRARQEALGLPEVDLAPYEKAAEAVTGLLSIPVSVAELAVSLGEYELSKDGEEVIVPLAHTEGGLTASVQRGAKAVAESGGFRTYVIADRITRASCFICKDAGDALALARWIEGEVPAMREFLREADTPSSRATPSCARPRRTSSGRCAMSSGASRRAMPSART
jgi:hydroxymethylglutaryl-CoA reductase